MFSKLKKSKKGKVNPKSQSQKKSNQQISKSKKVNLPRSDFFFTFFWPFFFWLGGLFFTLFFDFLTFLKTFFDFFFLGFFSFFDFFELWPTVDFFSIFYFLTFLTFLDSSSPPRRGATVLTFLVFFRLFWTFSDFFYIFWLWAVVYGWRFLDFFRFFFDLLTFQFDLFFEVDFSSWLFWLLNHGFWPYHMKVF